jgi:hypothetical protein
VRSLRHGLRDVFASATPGIGAGYEVQLVAAGGTLAHGPTLYGELAFGKGTLRPVMWLTGQYRWPVSKEPAAADSDGPPVGFRMDAIALRALAGVRLALAHQMTLEAAAGGGLDIVGLEPKRAAGETSVWLSPKDSFLVGLGRAMVGVRWRLSNSVSARATLLADVGGNRTRLLFHDVTTTQLVQPAWYAVRPGLALSLSTP